MPCSNCGGDRLQDVIAELMPGAGLPPRSPAPGTGPASPVRSSGGGPRWVPLPPDVEAKLDRVIRGWLGTRYMDNQRVRGGGVDCRHLAAAILDEWSGKPGRTELPPAPRDSGIHDPRRGFRTAKAIRERYPAVVVRDGSLQPGDILVVSAEQQGSALGRMGHALIVTPRRYTAVHATPRGGVQFVALGQFRILRNYRSTEKTQWT